MILKLTRNDITRIHRIAVLDEAEAIHEFDLSDLTGAMALEVVLNIRLGSYGSISSCSRSDIFIVLERFGVL